MRDLSERLRKLFWGLLQRVGLGVGIVGAAFGLTAGTTQGVEWTVSSRVSEQIVFDDNIHLDVESPGYVVGTLTNLIAEMSAKTPTVEADFGADLDFAAFGGPGETSNLDSANQLVTAKLKKAMKTTGFDLSASLSRKAASFSEETDTGLTRADTSRLTFNQSAAVFYQVNRRNQISLNVAGTFVNFTKSSAGLSPFSHISANSSWAHSISETCDTTGSVGVGWYSAENESETESWSFTAKGGASSRLSPRLMVSGGGGIRVVNTTNKLVGAMPPATRSDTSFGATGDLSVDYQLETTQYSLTASHGLFPSASGELKVLSRVALAITHKITEDSAIALVLAYSHRTSSSSSESGSSAGDRDMLILSPVYSVTLAEDWQASLGYRLRMKSSTDGTATSNKIFLTIVRNFTVLP